MSSDSARRGGGPRVRPQTPEESERWNPELLAALDGEYQRGPYDGKSQGLPWPTFLALYRWVHATEGVAAQLADLRGAHQHLIDVAGEALGTDPADRSPGCVQALADWSHQLRDEFADLRGERDHLSQQIDKLLAQLKLQDGDIRKLYDENVALRGAAAALQQQRQTPEAAICDAVVSAFEALQARGIYLHDNAGAVLGRQQFIDTMVVAMNAALASREKHESRSPDGIMNHDSKLEAADGRRDVRDVSPVVSSTGLQDQARQGANVFGEVRERAPGQESLEAASIDRAQAPRQPESVQGSDARSDRPDMPEMWEDGGGEWSPSGRASNHAGRTGWNLHTGERRSALPDLPRQSGTVGSSLAPEPADSLSTQSANAQADLARLRSRGQALVQQIQHELEQHVACVPSEGCVNRSDEIIGFHRGLQWCADALRAALAPGTDQPST